MHRRRKIKNPKDSSKARIRAGHRTCPCIPLCLDGYNDGIVLRCADAAPTPTVKVSLSVLSAIPNSVLGGSYDLPKSILSVLRRSRNPCFDYGESLGFVLTQNNAVLPARVVVVLVSQDTGSAVPAQRWSGGNYERDDDRRDCLLRPGQRR